MKKIGRFLSRLYWIAAFILAVVSAFEAESQKLATAGIALFFAAFVYFVIRIVVKLFPRMLRSELRSARTPSRISDRIATSVSNSLYTFCDMECPDGSNADILEKRRRDAQEAYERRAEENRRSWTRYQATKEANFHEYQAKRYAGTRDGHRHQNLAWAARNRAKYI